MHSNSTVVAVVVVVAVVMAGSGKTGDNPRLFKESSSVNTQALRRVPFWPTLVHTKPICSNPLPKSTVQPLP